MQYRVMKDSNLVELRKSLDPHFCGDTSVDPNNYRGGSEGHCAAVALLIYSIVGGKFVSTRSEGTSHWFNRLYLPEGARDVDLTGDQFGHDAVRVVPVGELYPDGVLREKHEVSRSTRDRARLLAKRAGLSVPEDM